MPEGKKAAVPAPKPVREEDLYSAKTHLHQPVPVQETATVSATAQLADAPEGALPSEVRPEIVTWEKLCEAIKASGRSYNMEMIEKAYDLANTAHKGVCRRSGEPYICHPLAVARLVLDLGMDSESIAAALLHDVVEDTPTTLDDLKAAFGEEVALLVDGVTKLTKIQFSNIEELQAENLRKMLLAMSRDVRVMIIKLCDRLHNMRTGDAWPEQKRRDKARETMEVYAPIANRLGILNVKEELEDRSLHYLDPVGYEEISRMLSEARELGVVEITVHTPGQQRQDLTEQLCARWSLRDVVLCPAQGGDGQTNQTLALAAIALRERLRARRVGIGWGHLIGQLVTWLEENPQPSSTVTDIFPLVGNASIPARNYQSNENVRLMAQQLGAAPHFLYLPALPESLEEKQLLCSTEVYRQIQDQWVQMDTALVNIGNYPSSPDFASLVRYGSLLQQQHTCGRLLVYYFNEAGTVIQSDQDFAIQIPLELLKQCPHIVGFCSANTSEKALRGALRSGIFTHIAARAELVKSLLGQ